MSTRFGPQEFDARIVALIPGGGWRARYERGTNNEWTLPLVAWGLTEDGIVVPLTTDADGIVEPAETQADIYHPSTEHPAEDSP